MKLLKAMATVAGLTGLSRLFGFIRDVLTASILGAGPIADAFFVALKLPNFFRRVTAEGAFSVAFVPLYSESIEKEGREEADAFASNAFMVMMLILSAVTLLALAFMPAIISVIAPGFVNEVPDIICVTHPCPGDRFFFAVEFSRITFPYLLLMSLTALLGGVLNAIDRFAPFAFAPVLFNLCLIAALLLAGEFKTTGHALSYGVLFAGVLQLVWLIVAARRAKIHLRLKRPKFKDEKIKKVFKLMGPGVIGAGVMHINLLADMIIASFLGAGSISYLYYADRLNQLPLGVVGIAVGTALLPMLSKAMAKGDEGESRNLFNRALEMCLLLALPAAVALAVIPLPLISTLFERGVFSAEDSAVTAQVLMAYALGLPAYISIKVFSTAHWARQDTVTPVKISVVATVLNIALSLVFIQFMGVAGIALATGLTGWLQFVLHIRALKGYKAVQFDERFKAVWPRIVLASAIMGVGLYLNGYITGGFGGADGWRKIFELAVLIVGGMAVYGLSIVALGVLKPSEVKAYLGKGKIS
ncbi:MAG: murein biosynthesis integral membrane protein MurJ [Pseudomonadota bacterium]